ncbi:TAXI family TRAP transporter solute-binding subunit [Falsiroseomonas oryzae]|uniref:TAXI family TRAP transporter solute-binding subunit n=1 Tax=Falsiroseomonas oryzae TaxID=2766473 RepID=UPI0022EAA311|nr:TAXI family TRAP transporter solute-binding subunit [Roseomonas sp. MO-31]
MSGQGLERRRLLGGVLGGMLGGGVALPVRAQAPLPGTPPASLQAMSARANAGTVGIVSGGVDGTYVRIAADLAAVLDSGDELRVLPIIGRGSVQNLADIMFLRGVDIGIVQSDVLAFAQRQRMFPGVTTMVHYIAKLYDEELHLLAAPGIAGVEDLEGRVVNVDRRGSGTAMTAQLVFEGLGIRIEAAHDPQDVALERLRTGEIAAMAFVAGQPARIFAQLPQGSGLRFLPLPLTPALLDTYLPARLTAARYPTLVPEGQEVETLAVGAAMAVYAWQPGTERHRKVARFVEAFFARFDEFRRPPRHAKWLEVNLAAQVPGWTRFGVAQMLATRMDDGRTGR